MKSLFKILLFKILLLFAAALLLAYSVAWGATKTWTGNSSTIWSTSSNWDTGVPGAADAAIIPSGRPNYPVISSALTGVTSVTINSGGSITMNAGGSLTLSGNFQVDGTFTMNGGSLTVKDFKGTGTTSISGGTLTIDHDFKPSWGTFIATGGTVVFTGNAGNGAFPSGLSTTQFFNVQINSGVDPKFDNNAVSFSVAGDWTNNSTGLSLAAKATTVSFNGSSTQTIGGSQSTTFRNVTINNSGSTVTLARNQTVTNGNLTISTGILDLSSYTMNRSSSGGTLTVSNGATLKIGGTNGFPSNYSTHTLGSTSTVEYSGANQTVSNESYGNLTLSGSGTKTMPDSAMTIAGNFTISGTASAAARANITVNGNFTIDAGATFDAASYTLDVDGDFTVNGTFNEGTSTVQINSNHGQLVSAAVHNLIVNSSQGLALGRNSIVKNTLQLTQGKLNLGSYNLILDTTATISGASPSKYVVIDGAGTFTRKGVGGSNAVFPIGTASNYNPVTVSNSGGAADFTVRIDTAFDYAVPNSNKVVKRQWKITRTGAGTSTVTFQWTSGDEGSAFDRAGTLVVLHHNGTIWEQFPATFSDLGGGVYTASVSGITSFSPFGVGNDGALPIQLASSSAQVIRGNDVEVAWRTVSERNNYGFEIYRKRGDSGNWINIGFIPGQGTTLTPQSYSYLDRAVPFGKYSYRIKQIDLDGKSELFPEMEVAVGVSTDKVILGQNYPNPFNPTTTIDFVVPQSGFATLKVYNMLGQEMATLFEGAADAGEVYTSRFNALNLPSGLYFYTLRATGSVETRRMLLIK